MMDFDVIIVGSGPTGVSAAFAVAESGLRILLLDASEAEATKNLTQNYLDARRSDPDQWKWMVGEDFAALKERDASSPKLRIPGYSHVFAGYNEKNSIVGRDFMTIGSLAAGGLSNVWGCGVACYSERELAWFPCPAEEMEDSYARVARRIGISGQADDDLTDYFGVDAWAQPPIECDAVHRFMAKQYQKHRAAMVRDGWRAGRPRIAVLSDGLNGRVACQRSGNCMWGCQHHALYNAADEIPHLEKFGNVRYVSGSVVQALVREGAGWRVVGECRHSGERQSFRGRKVLLAAGALASTRLALAALNHRAPVPLQSCPTGAFLLFLPRFLGTARQPSFGLGQLSFAFDAGENVPVFGSTFSTAGIAVSEFLRYIPMRRRHSVALLRGLLGACVVGNLFMPGYLTDAVAQLTEDNELDVRGHHRGVVKGLMAAAGKKLRRAFWRMGAVVIPGSFTTGAPGSCIHYAGTLPMVHNPAPGQTNALGEVEGLSNVHIVDSACLPYLAEKSSALTIMANADRIGRAIVEALN